VLVFTDILEELDTSFFMVKVLFHVEDYSLNVGSAFFVVMTINIAVF